MKDFLNLFFSQFLSICANVFSFILLSFPWFWKRHWTNNSEQVHASLELIRFLMVDFLFNFTTKFFDTNLPKLWPINTIGRCHLYLHKTYSFAILNFEEIANWFLHFILVKSIFMWLKYIIECTPLTLLKRIVAHSCTIITIKKNNYTRTCPMFCNNSTPNIHCSGSPFYVYGMKKVSN
jgi:hypothetical protein